MIHEIEVSNINLCRYRDIPWEEVSKHIPKNPNYDKKGWNKVRGKPVRIITPPLDYLPEDAICEGPFYGLVDKEGHECEEIACIHYLEIGD